MLQFLYADRRKRELRVAGVIGEGEGGREKVREERGTGESPPFLPSIFPPPRPPLPLRLRLLSRLRKNRLMQQYNERLASRESAAQ